MKFNEAIEIVLKHEGGFSDHPNDTGGATRYGITERVARGAGYEGDMKELPLDTAKDIYRQNYWDRMRLDEIEDGRLRLLLMDTGVNMGVGTAGRILQRAHNLLSEGQITVDGAIGPITLEHINQINRRDNLLYTVEILRGYRYLEIVKNNGSQRVFIHGWFNRLRSVAGRGGELIIKEGEISVDDAIYKLADLLVEKLK
ncbi:glycoside hydrolase family 108 protein [Halarsenatibacter silvermanii]|uniref:Predicted Peptidoglycan domain-containing protein n=1 Tax=Halarsenatibacter silvermanii TaxID=321763 RepID=A0A1G9RDL4_9FIRM|nr:N-acetylmuramidase [Halarsenatibacter silvermanii]SDM21409.1 Predicted Peptidoglycan domain-containing protein [Halarsenatibacter silvermanii]